MDATTANIQLVLKERLARDMQLWDTLFNSYAKESIIRISWYQGDARGFTDRSRDMAERGGFHVFHQLQPPVVWLNPDETRGTVIFGGSILSRANVKDDSEQEILVDTESHSRFVFTTTKEEGEWKIRSLDCVYLKDSMSPALPGQQILIDPKSLSDFRPSYRMLSWALTKRGYTIKADLPGEDRPETTRAILADAFDWVEAKVS